MDSDLGERLIAAFIRIKKSTLTMPPNVELPFGLMHLLDRIRHLNKAGVNVYVSDLQEKMQLSKPAVSQMLNSLEQKNLIKREINKTDRRKIEVSITDEGINALNKADEHFKSFINEITKRLGEDNTKQLLFLIEKLETISSDLLNEHTCNQYQCKGE